VLVLLVVMFGMVHQFFDCLWGGPSICLGDVYVFVCMVDVCCFGLCALLGCVIFVCVRLIKPVFLYVVL